MNTTRKSKITIATALVQDIYAPQHIGIKIKLPTLTGDQQQEIISSLNSKQTIPFHISPFAAEQLESLLVTLRHHQASIPELCLSSVQNEYFIHIHSSFTNRKKFEDFIEVANVFITA